MPSNLRMPYINLMKDNYIVKCVIIFLVCLLGRRKTGLIFPDNMKYDIYIDFTLSV